MKTLTIKVTPTGRVTLETAGFTGSECLQATEPIERALGTVEDRTPRPEMYQTTTTDDVDLKTGG